METQAPSQPKSNLMRKCPPATQRRDKSIILFAILPQLQIMPGMNCSCCQFKATSGVYSHDCNAFCTLRW